MAVFRVVLLLVFAITVGAGSAAGGGKGKARFKDVKLEGVLKKDDENDPQRNTPRKVHVVKLLAGQRYTIDMVGKGFDAYLRLEDPAGKELAEDDDSGGGLNAQIVYNCTKDGDYRVICTCLGPATGNYTLTVKAAGALAPDTTHTALLGQPAPDVAADFVLNGKVARLAGLKGKVVLLNFWAVQSGESVAAMSQLRDWQKTYQDAGLAVVSVTYFNSDFGHKLSFDPRTGELGRAATADPTSDQALLKSLAAYHKLSHPLLLLHKDNAVRVFDNYLVDGLPQFVLIDRDGIVRFVCVGAAQVRNPEVEGQLRKLLAPSK